MAVAGKVAITLSTENGGAWSADVTYDRLVAVKHNNNLYISRKTVANVEPPNNEFWFLALEGFSGDDIEDIIDGTTQVGNAKTLDGHGAEYFLPETGGTASNHGRKIMSVKSLDGNASSIGFEGVNGLIGELGVSDITSERVPFFKDKDGTTRKLFHEGNKPTGTYTGNGSATARTVNVGGIGGVLLVHGYGYYIFVTRSGAICTHYDSTTVMALKRSDIMFDGGFLTITTNNEAVNNSGSEYSYTVL